MCKHSVGLLYKCGVLEITSDVRSKPLGQKRRRGRPKKLPFCLVNSPDRVPSNVDNIPRASYIPSPNKSLNASMIIDEPVTLSRVFTPNPSSSPLPAVIHLPPIFSSSILAPHSPLESVAVSTRKRRREVSPVELPPAKRISKQNQDKNPKNGNRGRRRKPENSKEPEKTPQKTVKIFVNNISPNIFDIQRKRKYNKRK